MTAYGYRDEGIRGPEQPWTLWRAVSLLFALGLVVGAWYALDQKLLHGDEWLSETYDNPDWRTNEGDLHTFGMWDLEAHVWKTEYILENWPHFQWNPYWYLGMPLLKYYQPGFYIAHAAVHFVTGAGLARAALLLIVWSHLLAALMTFLLCYKISRRLWTSAFCSVFVIANTFITLRSYGWEPITVVFLWLFPLGLLLFLREPLRPFRPAMLAVMLISYLSHPLLFFSLCMTMGLYLFSVAMRHRQRHEEGVKRNYLWQYFGLVLASLVIGAVQFFPQGSYHQATSGAHMGVKYLPFYQVPFNIITPFDFLFDAGNLKGPGPVLLIALFLLLFFAFTQRGKSGTKTWMGNELVSGTAFVLAFMVLFYYIEAYNIFPMNFLRSIQYHRIIPEFVVVACALIAGSANLATTFRQKVVYYTVIIGFTAASFIVIYNVQQHWETTETIAERPEFIHEEFDGRFTVTYLQQSVSVRNSFTEKPQVYGYYEQGITNSYNDEIFSVSSGYHNAELTILYLEAANVARVYVNNEEGNRDEILKRRLNSSLVLHPGAHARYSYFEIPLVDPDYAQAIEGRNARAVLELAPQCRELFKENYCGSVQEEFVGTDPQEVRYLKAYVELLRRQHVAEADFEMVHADLYHIRVTNAIPRTMVVVKMTYDDDFVALVDGEEVPIERFGPDFMLIDPGREGAYTIELRYRLAPEITYGAVASLLGLLFFTLYFLFRPQGGFRLRWTKGDMG